jgi:tetratricopeptide (TPR) repeat protein
MRLPKQLQSSIIALALMIASGIASGQTAAQTDNLAEAQRLLKQGQHSQALSRADAYVLAKPRDPQGRFVKGLILAEMNRNNEAIAVFKKLTEDFPELPEPFNNLAVLYAQEKQFDKARSALEAAIKTHPSYAVAHENLGDVYAKLASQAYGKALQIDKANPTAQNKLELIRDLISVTAKPGSKPVEPAKVVAVAPATPTPAKPAASVAPLAVAPAVPAVVVPPKPSPALAAPAVIGKPTAPLASQAPSKAAPTLTPPAPPVAAATAPTDKAPVPSAAQQEIAGALDNWAAAWARKDVKAYLAHYATDFQTPGGQGRRAWEEERSSRINKPGKIEVSAEKVVVDLNGADKATVRFRQHYKSANLSSSAKKTLVFVRSGNRWLIQQERVN